MCSTARHTEAAFSSEVSTVVQFVGASHGVPLFVLPTAASDVLSAGAHFHITRYSPCGSFLASDSFMGSCCLTVCCCQPRPRFTF